MSKNDPKDIPTTIAGAKVPDLSADADRMEAEVQRRVSLALAKVAKAPTVEPSLSTGLDERIATAVAKAMAAAAPAMAGAMGNAIMAAQAATKMSEHELTLVARRAKLALEEKCSICRQPVGDGKRRGCGGPWRRDLKTNQFVTEPVYEADGVTQALDGEGKPMVKRIEDPHQFHIMKVVFPKDPLAYKWFDGINLNGALYWSQGPGHEVWVPRNSDLDYLLSQYTQGEVEQRVGRSHVRSNGGTVSGRGGAHSGPRMGDGFQ